MPAFLLVATFGLAVAAQLAGVREVWLALACLPAVFFAAGFGWARWLAGRAEGPEVDGVRVGFDAFWLSLPAAALGWALARVAGGGAWTVLAVSGAVGLAGTVRAWGLGGAWRPARRELAGLGVGLVLLAVWFGRSAADIARPLDRYWYLAGVEERLPEASTAPPFEGDAVAIGEPEAGVLRGGLGAPLVLHGPTGAFVVAAHGPVGAAVTGLGAPLTVSAEPVESADEGPVWRYRGAGVGAAWAGPLAAGETLTLTPDHEVELYLIFAQRGVWTLYGSGELRWTHYYQLLNMVEQLRWADTRWVTDVQPPLWTWVLAPALTLTGGGHPTANVLLLVTLGVGVLGGLLFLRRYAPDAPWAAWALPGAAAAVVGKLVLEPGSAGMPDALYGVAIVAGLTARAPIFGLAAQLLRYPGAAVVFAGALVRGRRDEARQLALAVLAAMVLFGLGGLATGALDGWLRTVAWESGPEHWHGEVDPGVLLGRTPEFYRLWLLYGGGTAALAALRWPPGTRVALGTALAYSLLLCTIDHSPTHYFVPLVWLGALALGTTAASWPRREAGEVLAALGVAGLATFWWSGQIQA